MKEKEGEKRLEKEKAAEKKKKVTIKRKRKEQEKNKLKVIHGIYLYLMILEFISSQTVIELYFLLVLIKKEYQHEAS